MGRPARRSWRRTGRQRVEQRTRSLPRSKRPPRRRPCSAWRKHSRTPSGRSRSGRLVPAAAELVRVDLVYLHAWAAELASLTGAAPRGCGAYSASNRSRRAEGSVACRTPLRGGSVNTCTKAARPMPHSSRSNGWSISVPDDRHPRRNAPGLWRGLGHRIDARLALRRIARRSASRRSPLARSTGGARSVELRTLLNLGRDLAYLGRADEGV